MTIKIFSKFDKEVATYGIVLVLRHVRDNVMNSSLIHS